MNIILRVISWISSDFLLIKLLSLVNLCHAIESLFILSYVIIALLFQIELNQRALRII